MNSRRLNALLLLVILVGCLSIPQPLLAAGGTNYYVDSINGSDSNSGTSSSRPWKTLAPVHAHRFAPGDRIHFKRGGTWSGGLVIDNSGTRGNPIVFTTYGSGARPVFRNPGTASRLTSAIYVRADYVVVEGLLARNTSEAGVNIERGADYNVVRDLEITDVGIGVAIDGTHNLITRNYIHDLHMVRSTPGGDDDYGAVGIWVFNSYNEISYNRLVNCKAPSQDYVQDGGAIEWWGSITGTYVHRNWASGCEGFLEIGSQGGTVENTKVAYNVSINNGWFAMFSLTGKFGTRVKNFKIEHNTVVQNVPHDGWGARYLLYFDARPAADTVLLKNNIMVVKGWNISTHAGFTHHHNLYSLGSGDRLGFTRGTGEILGAPRFVNPAGQDYHLQSGSPAINAGANLGYRRDFEGGLVPTGSYPDLGAFEYGAK